MRKCIIGHGSGEVATAESGWLDLENLAQVEITSEDVGYPIESALIPGTGKGWRAAQPGEQTIRLLFEEPLKLIRIHLVFHEADHERTQEFVLRWSPDGGQSYQEIVHQQYNFSPPGATSEVEDYTVDLDGVTALELRIMPDISGGGARASLAQLRVASLSGTMATGAMGYSLTEGRIKGDGMNEQETKKEIAQAKKDLLDARAKLKELSAKLREISDVVEKIEAAQGRLQKVEEKLFLEGFSKKSYFRPIGNGKE